MKKIITYFIVTIILIVFAEYTFAQANKQHTWSVNFGPELIAPERKFWVTHRIGLGGSIKGE